VTVIEIPTPDPRTFDETSRPFAEAVAAQYAVKKMIGRGGMGIVYLARDRRLDRLVAIKTLPPQLAADPAVRERFIRETRAAGGMSHPNIVPIHGADEIDGHVFFVMGYVDGESLATHVTARGRLDPKTVVELLRDVASALSHAHRRGIVHRDIKAENILIERATGRALVTDFGIARLAEAAPLTATGQLLGTVYYVSPEQVSGERVDQRSDLYSLGVVGYLALTGCFPFDAELASAVLVAHVTRPAPRVRDANPDVPEPLAAVIDRCLAKDPAARFANAGELITALENVTRGNAKDVAPPARKPKISDTEAQAVWQRAANLQALTGVIMRADLPPQARDAEQDRIRTSGFSITEIRSAASQAGIGESYVERALVEHGLGVTRQPVVSTLPRTALRGSLWAGAPLDIVVDAEVDANVESRRFERLINALREGTDTVGVTTTKSRELMWRGAWFGHRLEASVAPDGARTRIRLSQSIRRAALAAMSATIAVGGAVGAAVGVGLIELHLHAPPWGFRIHRVDGMVLTTVAGIGVGLLLGRALVRRLRNYNNARLHTLTELLALRAGEDGRDD